MENNKVKIILVIAMIGVWGLLGKKVYNKVFPSTGTIIRPTNVAPQAVAKAALASYELSLDYKDPFLGQSITPRSKTSSSVNNPTASTTKSKGIADPKNAKKKEKAAKKPKPLKWPSVEYLGLITLKTGGTAAILSVDNQVENLSPFESINEVKVIQIFPDSVLVIFKEEKKIVSR